jgi:hypothetical protein
MTKLALYKEGKTLFCKTHGWHEKWRVHTANNVQCRKCAVDYQKVAREKEPIKYIFRDAKQHAKAKNREFTITLDDLFEVLLNQTNKCALTDVLFSSETKPSLDRIDSSKGYTKENIQFVLKEINIMKSNFNESKFIELCTLVAKTQVKKRK